jgi:hypothetical protein
MAVNYYSNFAFQAFTYIHGIHWRIDPSHTFIEEGVKDEV